MLDDKRKISVFIPLGCPGEKVKLIQACLKELEKLNISDELKTCIEKGYVNPKNMEQDIAQTAEYFEILARHSHDMAEILRCFLKLASNPYGENKINEQWVKTTFEKVTDATSAIKDGLRIIEMVETRLFTTILALCQQRPWPVKVQELFKDYNNNPP